LKGTNILPAHPCGEKARPEAMRSPPTSPPKSAETPKELPRAKSAPQLRDRDSPDNVQQTPPPVPPIQELPPAADAPPAAEDPAPFDEAAATKAAKKLKVVELRAALEAAGADTKGLKAALVERLVAAQRAASLL